MKGKKTMTKTIDTSAIEINVQGETRVVDFNDFPTVTQDTNIVYGTRRYIQDRINSEAHAAKKAGDTYDAATRVDELIDDMLNGVTTSRKAASPVDPLESFVVTATRTVLMKNKAFAHDRKVYEAIDSTDQQARKECLLTIAKDHESAIMPIAKALKASHDALAALSLDDDADESDVA